MGSLDLSAPFSSGSQGEGENLAPRFTNFLEVGRRPVGRLDERGVFSSRKKPTERGPKVRFLLGGYCFFFQLLGGLNVRRYIIRIYYEVYIYIYVDDIDFTSS